MKKVFESNKIGSIKMTNRIIRAATHEGLADNQGRPTEALKNKYVALAKGEVGAIITGYAGVMQQGKSSLHNMLMIDKDEMIPAYKELVDAVHSYHTPIILQIAHAGRQTTPKAVGGEKVAPSAIKDKVYRESLPRELKTDEIYEVIEAFVDAIIRAKKSGFDGVELHLAHGYLLSSFLSPHMNKRHDQWGGSSENRFRIVKEILIRARNKVGDYPILAKVNGSEISKDGLKLDEAILYATWLEQYGCSAIEVSCGIIEEGLVTIRGQVPSDAFINENDRLSKLPKMFHPIIKKTIESVIVQPNPKELYNVDSASAIKKAVNIPVIVVGGIRHLEDINRIIESGQSDYVSLSRPFILEPTLVKKFRGGHQKSSKCIDCNYCMVIEKDKTFKCYYGKI